MHYAAHWTTGSVSCTANCSQMVLFMVASYDSNIERDWMKGMKIDILYLNVKGNINFVAQPSWKPFPR